ncbi:hypothetical protein [Acinetobacter baumannii]|uniref:hypothetical protein n=1 Tax=Acinetobacter baumannii TaxID=470 RepID=UPI0038914D3A
MKAIYINNEGIVSVVHSTELALQRYTIEEIAILSIPLNVPFWIVEDELIPADREYRNAWELDLDTIGNPSGYGGQE